MLNEDCVKTVNIKVNNNIIVCSRDDLICRSKYFAAMFNGSFREHKQNVVELKNVPESMTEALKYLLARDPPSIENLHQPFLVLEASVIYQFEKDTVDCEKFVLKNLHHYLITAIEVGRDLDIGSLRRKALFLCLLQFEELKNSICFAAIEDVNTLFEILDHVYLVAASEMNVFGAIMFWISHDHDCANIQKLMQAVRFAKLSSKEIYEIASENIVKNNKTCHELLQILISLKKGENTYLCQNCLNQVREERCNCKVSDNMKELVLTVWNKKRSSPFVPCLIGQNASEEIFLYKCDFSRLKCEKAFDCPPSEIAKRGKHNLIGFRLSSSGVNVYLFGGEWGLGRGAFNMEIWCFNTITETWNVVGKIYLPRRHFLICSNLEYIFLVGGTGKHRITLENIEAFNIRTGVSELFVVDNLGRIDSACVSGDYLYILLDSQLRRIDIKTKQVMHVRRIRMLGSKFIHIHRNWLYYFYDDCLMKCRIDVEDIPEITVQISCENEFFISENESHEIVSDNWLYSFFRGSGLNLICKTVYLGDCLYTLSDINFEVDFLNVLGTCLIFDV